MGGHLLRRDKCSRKDLRGRQQGPIMPSDLQRLPPLPVSDNIVNDIAAVPVKSYFRRRQKTFGHQTAGSGHAWLWCCQIEIYLDN